MTGIALGDLNIPKISMGDTPIVKVSMGDTLVWPAGSSSAIDYVTVPTYSSGSTAAAIPYPAGCMAGDVIIFIERATANVTAPSEQYPAGFTKLHDFQSVVLGTCRFCASYKVLTQADIDTPIALLGMNGQTNRQRVALRVQGWKDGSSDAMITNVFVWPITPQMVTGNPIAYTVDAALNGLNTSNAITVCAYGASAAVNPRTWTGPAGDLEISASTLMYVKYCINFAEMAAIGMDMDDEGDFNTLAPMQLAFT